MTPIRFGRHLTDEQRQELAERYFNRSRSGETSQEIAKAFGVVRQYVPAIARQVTHKQDSPATPSDRLNRDGA